MGKKAGGAGIGQGLCLRLPRDELALGRYKPGADPTTRRRRGLAAATVAVGDTFQGGGSPQLYYHDCSGRIPGHTTRAPPVGFELETNGFQFYAIANLDKTSYCDHSHPKITH